MLLRQKAIVEGGLALLGVASKLSDLSEHAAEESVRRRSFLLLDLLTPIAKTFPAEKGFEANALSIQVHGGYGYSSEYLPEAWLRDQKLNSLHEGTTGIQSLDLLGRKVRQEGGAAIRYLGEEIRSALGRAGRAGVPPSWSERLESAFSELTRTTDHLTSLGDAGSMLRHSYDYLELFSTVVVGWMWLLQAAVAKEALDRGAAPAEFYEGKLCAAQYWTHTELPRVATLAALCRSGDDSYDRLHPDWL
jgi:butyryl-CoA dehydrogenase